VISAAEFGPAAAQIAASARAAERKAASGDRRSRAPAELDRKTVSLGVGDRIGGI
jgi:hypothetical protein